MWCLLSRIIFLILHAQLKVMYTIHYEVKWMAQRVEYLYSYSPIYWLSVYNVAGWWVATLINKSAKALVSEALLSARAYAQVVR